MFSSIKTILKPFQKDLDTFEEYFKKSMSSNVKIIDQVARYMVKRRGKQLRPTLLLLSTRTEAEPNQSAYLAAVVVELLHTATLVHDDVIDESEIRRGFPTINKIWKNKISILMGDYLLSKSLIIATEIGNIELMNIIANVAKRMSKGELLQIQKSRKLNINEEEYFQLISDKTASLISACCEIGALTSGASLDKRQILRDFGENLGIAFQIKDDLLDYQSRTSIIGKPVGNDLKEKKITLPLLYAFHASENGEKKKILRMLKNGVQRREVNAIINFINRYEGLMKAQEKAEYHKDLAITVLNNLPSSPARTVLTNLAEFVVNRQK